MSKEQGALLLTMKKDGTYVRSKLKSFRVHENGITKQLNDFSGEVIIEEGTDSLTLDMLRQTPHKNAGASMSAMIGGYSVLLIIFGMALHRLLVLRTVLGN